jgi:hypothetical protein
LSWLLVVSFATGAQAGDDSSTWPSTWIRVCVLPAPGINVWSYSGGKTIPHMDKEVFRKISRGLLVFAFDPNAPPESRERLPPPDNLLPCAPKPPPQPPTEEQKKDETPKPAEKEAPKSADKKPADPAAAPSKKEEAPVQLPPLIVYPKKEKEKDTEPRPRPPVNGVTARWPETVLPMKTETVLPNRPMLPVVRREDTEQLPMTHVLPFKDKSAGGGSGSGDGTGNGPKKTTFEKVAEELAFGGAIMTQQMNEDTKRADGKQYGIPGGQNADGPNHPAA